MAYTEFKCPNCQNKLYRRRESIEKHFFKPCILKETLSCSVCGWVKHFRLKGHLNGTLEREDWEESEGLI